MTRTSTVIKHTIATVYNSSRISKDVGYLSKVRWIEVSIQPQQYQRMLDFYPRSYGSSVHHRAQRMLEEVFTPQQYQRMLDLKSKVRWIECPSYSSKNVGGSFYTTTISKHVGSLIQRIVECPCKHTNFMTSPTYGGDCFLVGFPDQFPVNISESTERMLAGEWSGRLAGKYSPLQRKTHEIT